MSGKLLCLLFLLCSPLAIAFRLRSLTREDPAAGDGDTDDDTDNETSTETDDDEGATMTIARNVRSPAGDGDTDDDTDNETSTETDDDEGATMTIARNVRSPAGDGDTDDDTDNETSTETDDDEGATMTIARNVRSPDDDADETETEIESDDDADEGVTPGFIPNMQMVAGPPPVPEPQEECFNISVSVPEYVEHEDVAISNGMTIVNVTVLQDNSISGACNYVITDTAMYVNSTCSADFEICLLPLKP